MNLIVTPRLKELLKERGMTQTKLSELTNIPQGTISNFDRSKLHQDNHLISISRVLNVSIEDLFIIEDSTSN